MLISASRSTSSRVLDPASHESLGVSVREVDIATLEAPSEEHAVRILHQLDESRPSAFHHRVVRMRRCPDPGLAVEVVFEIGPPDDADVVELESLCGVDAADLIDTSRIVGP